jgi:hypothetical protein
MHGLMLDELTAHVATRVVSDDSLDRLDAALALATQIDHQADALVDRFVAVARADGRSWTEIGARLGRRYRRHHPRQAWRYRQGDHDIRAAALRRGSPGRRAATAAVAQRTIQAVNTPQGSDPYARNDTW